MNAASCRQAPAAHSRQMPAVKHCLPTFEGMRRVSPSTSSSVPVVSGRRAGISRRSAAITEARAGARKVALLGAAGGIGQPLALLLKMQPYVAELALYDIANTVGVAADLSHCNTSVQVSDQCLICTVKYGSGCVNGCRRPYLFKLETGRYLDADICVKPKSHMCHAVIHSETSSCSNCTRSAEPVRRVCKSGQASRSLSLDAGDWAHRGGEHCCMPGGR